MEAWRPGNPDHPSLGYLFARFARQGLLAWGGPVPQLARIHHEFIERDAWMTEERFAKTLAVYQALPGPEAMEMAVHLGMLKRGRPGAFVAGLGFMLPGLLLVTAVAALYVAFAATAGWADLLLYGVRPAVLALIAAGVWRLARANLKGPHLLAIAVIAAVVGLVLPSVNFLLVLFAGGALAWTAHMIARGHAIAFAAALPLAMTFPALSATGLAAVAILSTKVGLLTFGGAYTAIPFLHEGAVVEHGWLTESQFLDSLALAGIVPGPLIAVGVFVAYVAAGITGAALAAAIIFAPAFLFTMLGYPLFARLIDAPRLHAFLLGVTAAVIGLIVASSVPLALAALIDAPTILLGIGAFLALTRKWAPLPLVLATSAILGALLRLTPGLA